MNTGLWHSHSTLYSKDVLRIFLERRRPRHFCRMFLGGLLCMGIDLCYFQFMSTSLELFSFLRDTSFTYFELWKLSGTPTGKFTYVFGSRLTVANSFCVCHTILRGIRSVFFSEIFLSEVKLRAVQTMRAHHPWRNVQLKNNCNQGTYSCDTCN